MLSVLLISSIGILSASAQEVVTWQFSAKKTGNKQYEIHLKAKVDFIQKVTVKMTAKTRFSGTVEFMACTSSQCLSPQKVAFSILLE